MAARDYLPGFCDLAGTLSAAGGLGVPARRDLHKVATGTFLTKNDFWLVRPVVDFIGKQSFRTLLDPFAGEGDMLNAVHVLFPFAEKTGYDLYTDKWLHNDSLLSIPAKKETLIVTNPPYLAKYSARRKGVWEKVASYFENSPCEDLYQIALMRLAETQLSFVAIVPETVITSGLKIRGLERVVILLENPFTDTDVPVCVVCSSPGFSGDAEVFFGENFAGHFSTLLSKRIRPNKTVDIEFNAPQGNIGLRAIDSTDPRERIRFMPAEELSQKYGRERIKVSSRLLTYLEIHEKLPPAAGVKEICVSANAILEEIRGASHDVVLSPFKGNARNGVRRRRLDYTLARAILERAVEKFLPEHRSQNSVF